MKLLLYSVSIAVTAPAAAAAAAAAAVVPQTTVNAAAVGLLLLLLLLVASAAAVWKIFGKATPAVFLMLMATTIVNLLMHLTHPCLVAGWNGTATTLPRS